MDMLIGDVNPNCFVNASDVAQTKAQLGQPVTTSNFRADVNPNGIINASDVVHVKFLIGTSLPRRNRITRATSYGTIANTRAGNAEPPFGFGKLTTTMAPDSGT